ncbi:MAG TPA: glutathione S-transferase family protein [Candidatus Eisenbacteria bacterium]|nr:glutathione S-transferase family protein [Candidatus Eisenbacteria bacterium]
MLIVFEHPLSPYVQKVKIALGEKGVPFETRMPDIIGGSNLDEFVKLNPRLEVPTLVDGDASIFDSTIILEYIEEKWPTPALLPATPLERARARMIEEVCDTYYEAVNWALMEIRAFQRATGELADRLVGRAAEQTAGVQNWLARHLGTQPYFGGATFGWADVCVAPFVHASATFGNAPAPETPLAAWLDRIRARPSVATTFEAAAASMQGFEMLPQLVASGVFKREYRDHRLEWMLRSGGADIVIEGIRKENIRFTREFS